MTNTATSPAPDTLGHLMRQNDVGLFTAGVDPQVVGMSMKTNFVFAQVNAFATELRREFEEARATTLRLLERSTPISALFGGELDEEPCPLVTMHEDLCRVGKLSAGRAAGQDVHFKGKSIRFKNRRLVPSVPFHRTSSWNSLTPLER